MIRQTEQMISLRQPRVPVKPPASTTNALHTMQANQPGSRVERALRRALWSAGERGFRVQSRLPGKPDVVFPTARRAIFVHGCFWHRCARCAPPVPKRNREFWAHKFSTTVRRDASLGVTRELRRKACPREACLFFGNGPRVVILSRAESGERCSAALVVILRGAGWKEGGGEPEESQASSEGDQCARSTSGPQPRSF